MQVQTFVPPGFSQPPRTNKTTGKGNLEPTEVKEVPMHKIRKPERRGKGNKKKNTIDIKIVHSNIDGYTSKKESLNEIADKEKPDVITLNDTNLKGKLKVKVPGYFSFSKNREKFKGGVATVIANHLKNNTMKVKKTRVK